ncbi:MAG: hypothetical protein AAF570_00315 [Bacteroidota bacterium]
MTIALFLTVCLGALLSLLALPRHGLRAGNTGYTWREVHVAGVWLVLGLSAVWMINRYTYPASKDTVFGNSDYHLLQHQGFGFVDSLLLVDGKNQEKALWDDKTGRIWLKAEEDAFQLDMNRFFEPVFLRKEGQFVLQNNIYPAEVSDFLEIRKGKTPIFKLRMKPGQNDTTFYEVAFGKSETYTRSQFYSTLRYGYPLTDILRRTPGWENHAPVVEQFEGCLLVRETQNKTKAPLFFFPTRSFHDTLAMHMVTTEASVRPQQGRTEFDLKIAPKQRFYVGLGMDKGRTLYLENDSLGTQLRFDFPIRYRMNDDPVNDLFLCSNMDDVAQNGGDGGYFFSFFAQDDNAHHINANLRYVHGTARENLEMRVIDHFATQGEQMHRLRGGQDFALATKAQDDSVRWLLRLEDLRASNPYSRTLLIAFVLGFIALVFASVYLVRLPQLHTMEMMVYVLLFGFLVVRVLLQWRMSTFIPVEDVRPGEFAFLRSLGHFWKTAGVTAAFFGLRWLLIRDLEDHPGSGKVLGRIVRPMRGIRANMGARLEGWRDWWQKGMQSEAFLPFMVRFLVVALPIVMGGQLLKSMGFSGLERFINIGFPVAAFFLFEYVLDRNEGGENRRFLGLRPRALFNGLFWLAYLAASDAGFSIIFILFQLLYQAFRSLLPLAVGRRRGRGPSNELYVRAGIALAAFVAVLFLSDSLIEFVFAQPALFFWFGLLPPIFGLVAYFGAVVAKSIKSMETSGQWRTYGLISGGVAALFLVLMSGPIQQKTEDFGYVKYRAAIHSKNLDQIIQKERFSSGQVGQILRAAQNQWFINTYLRDQTYGGEESGYFSLKPHFNKGSSFTTQTTDLVVTRYVIAEHGASVVILLLLLFLAVTAFFAFQANLRENRQFVPFGMLLLLFTISFFIWLTATNRFIFFGQDFPLISLTSLFTLVFSAGLLLFVVVGLEKEKPGRKKTPRLILAPVAALFVIGAVLQQQNNVLDEGNFAFNLSLRQASSDFQRLNEDFGVFQENVDGNPQPDSVVKAFYAQLEDTIVSRNAFSQSIFEHFVKQQANKMNPEDLLHLVVRRGKYRFALNRSFYMIRPPQSQQNAWSGNLYAAREEVGGVYLLDMQDRSHHVLVPGDKIVTGLDQEIAPGQNKVNVSVIPASWLEGDQPAVIVWSDNPTTSKAEFSISNRESGTGAYTQDFANPAVRLLHDDLLNLHGPKGQKLRFKYLEDYNQFLAKNIWLNGERKLFYPLGDKLLWAYYYADAVQRALSGTDSATHNVRVSIDYPLTERLHNIAGRHFTENHWEKQRLGLVAVNGEGQLRAMIDYNPSGTIDPNDIKEFHDKNREFYLRNNNRSERETFGNINLLRLSNGPGSTLKPILYSAVASQYNLGWRTLRLEETPGSVVKQLQGERKAKQTPEEHAHFFSHYGGKEVNMTWGGIGEQDFWRHTPRTYLTYSKNLYHSMVVFFGSYSREWLASNLRRGDNPVLIPRKSAPDSLDFPAFNLGRGVEVFNPEGWPLTRRDGERFFGDRGSLIGKGLYSIYDLPTHRLRTRNPLSHTNIDPPGLGIFEKGGRGAQWYAYPELAKFYQSDRSVRGHRWFIYGFRQVASGSDPIAMTPFKMAEMGGKLYSFDQNYRVTFADSLPARKRQPFQADATWKGGYFNFVRDIVYGSMYNVVNVVDSTNGTAESLGRLLKRRQKKSKRPKYFYYAKTGTIGDAEDEERIEDKLLMLIISKNDVREIADPDELAENKFYVLYFTGLQLGVPEGMTRWKMFADMVEAVEDSWLFKKYMHGTE